MEKNANEWFVVSETTIHFVIRLRNGKFGIGAYKVSKNFLNEMIEKNGWRVLKIESITIN